MRHYLDRILLVIMLLNLLTSIRLCAEEPPPPPGPKTTKQTMMSSKRSSNSESSEKMVKMKFQDIDLAELLVFVGSEMGWNVIVDKSVSKRVSLSITKPIPVSQAFKLLLKLGDLEAVEVADRTYLVVPASSASKLLPKKRVSVHLKWLRPDKAVKLIKDAGIDVTAFEMPSADGIVIEGVELELKRAISLLQRMDVEDSAIITDRLKLDNAVAEEAVQIANQMISALGFDGISVIPDRRTNSLIFTGPKTAVEQVKRSVRDAIDVRGPQVLIAVDVLEVSREDSRGYGIEWGGEMMTILSESPNISTYGGYYGYYGGYYGSSEEGEGEYQNFISPPEQIRFEYRTPLQLQVILRFLYSDKHSRLIASPRILTCDGQEAKIMVGDRVPIVNQVMTSVYPGGTTTATTYNVEFIDIGTILEFKPRVTSDNYIYLEIKPQVSTLKSLIETIGGNKVPEIGTREAEVKLMVPDGQPIILGGLIRDDERTTFVKVPILGDIPVIGRLFQARTRDNVSSEIVFVIRPKIIRWDEEESEQLKFKGELPEYKQVQRTEGR